MKRVEHDLTAEQWAALRAAWGGCAYCADTNAPLQHCHLENGTELGRRFRIGHAE